MDSAQLLHRALIGSFASHVGQVLGLDEAREALAQENIALRGDREMLGARSANANGTCW